MKNKGGRPYIDFTEKDWRQIEAMCAMMCTGEEIASVLGVSYDTLERRVKEKYNISCADYIKEKSAGGRASLRRHQYKLAEAGNATMLIWLGKQYLGQTDKQETALTVNPLEDILDEIECEAREAQEESEE